MLVHFRFSAFFLVVLKMFCNDDQSDQVAGDRRMTFRGLGVFLCFAFVLLCFFVFVVILFFCRENVCKDDQCDQVAGDRRITFRN